MESQKEEELIPDLSLLKEHIFSKAKKYLNETFESDSNSSSCSSTEDNSVPFEIVKEEVQAQEEYKPRKNQIHRSLRLMRSYAHEEVEKIQKFF